MKSIKISPVLSFFLIHFVYTSSKPNVVIFLVDDLGFNDVGFHGNTLTKTPNIDKLAERSVVLTRHYTQPVCSPSRAALLSGRYPIHTGVQSGTIEANLPYGLPLNVSLISNYMRELDYSTHIVGKWHLGFFMKEYVPTMRGFETFFGYYGGSEHYYSHAASNVYFGLDFHDDVGETLSPAWDYFGQYSTDIFGDKAVGIINSQNFTERPLFLYLPFQGVHEPLEAKNDDFEYFDGVWAEGKFVYYAQVKAVDEAIGKVIQSLEGKNQLNNTIILFSSDNGGPQYTGWYASNYPLRSGKTYMFEGGVRTPAFVSGPGLRGQTTYENYIHLVDWLPTLYSAAGGNVTKLGDIDGVDHWQSLVNPQLKTGAPRSEILLNIDPVYGEAALIKGNYKLYTVDSKLHKVENGVFDQWYSYRGPMNETDTKRIDHIGNWALPLVGCGNRSKDDVVCNLTDGSNKYCLFDIINDPCEYNNIATKEQSIVKELKEALDGYRATMVAPLNKPNDPQSNPNYHNGVWVPWVTKETGGEGKKENT